MRERFRLFVYGHLRRGQIGHRLLELEQRTQWLGEARIHGCVYDLGDYPGLILGGEDIVHGEVIGFDDPALWALLDDYEDHDPEQPEISEYRRIEVGLLDESEPAWVYVFNRPIESLIPIVSGVWPSLQDRVRSTS
jgi:gamma-glutamylcyclotransferase (GGCT)/AIG2-like uncharacterized protein YtfP